MPATTTTTELFPKATVQRTQVQYEQQLRIKAGAIRSMIDDSDEENYILTTEWNVLGENDDVAAPARITDPASDLAPFTTTTPGPASTPPAYLATDPAEYMGQSVGTGQCVAFVQVAAGAPQTRLWRRGDRVKDVETLQSGAAIATFDHDGTYGNHTDGSSHAAIYIGRDSSGLIVYDQWLGQPVHQRTIRYGGAKPANDGNAFCIII